MAILVRAATPQGRTTGARACLSGRKRPINAARIRRLSAQSSAPQAPASVLVIGSGGREDALCHAIRLALADAVVGWLAG